VKIHVSSSDLELGLMVEGLQFHHANAGTVASNYATAATFHSPSNSLFTGHPTIFGRTDVNQQIQVRCRMWVDTWTVCSMFRG